MQDFTYYDPDLRKLGTIKVNEIVQPIPPLSAGYKYKPAEIENDFIKNLTKAYNPPPPENTIHFGSDGNSYVYSQNNWVKQITVNGDTADTTVDKEASRHTLVNHPPHYNKHPSGIECIQITRHMNFNLGNAVKYIWRADLKNDAIEDLKKAAWYIQDEIQRRENR